MIWAWTYAHDFILNDHMFEAVDSWSLPSHLYLVSNWSAHCTSANPDSCVNDPAQAAGRPDVREDAAILGNLYADFNFSQQPRPPVLLQAHPAPGPASVIP